MRKNLLASCLLALALTATPAPVKTAAQGERSRDVSASRAAGAREGASERKLYAESHALIIGVSEYTNGWESLPGVREDIPEVKAALERHGFIVEVMTDPYTTSKAIRTSIETFIENYGKDANNRLLIYVAAHGHTGKTADGRAIGYVVPADAPLPKADDRRFRQTAISMEKMEAYAKEIEARHAMFVFDSCFSGTLFSTMRGADELTPDIELLTEQPVRFFLTAGAENQPVPDRSLFRKAFVEGLGGAADFDRDGFVTGTELGTYVRREVTNFTRKQQTPQFGKILVWELARGDLVFKLSKTRPPAAEEEMAVGPTKPVVDIPAGEQGKKKLAPPRVSETAGGSRVSITAGDALDDYSAYRRGDRYYVILPNADATGLQKNIAGKDFTDAKVERRGRDVVLSFGVKPGTTARVNQRFNQLDVVFSDPAAPNP